jgi:hypothetical protein
VLLLRKSASRSASGVCRSATRARIVGQLFDAALELLQEPMLVPASDLKVQVASSAFCSAFKIDVQQTIGRKLHEIGAAQWHIPELCPSRIKAKPLRAIRRVSTCFASLFASLATRRRECPGADMEEMTIFPMSVEPTGFLPRAPVYAVHRNEPV